MSFTDDEGKYRLLKPGKFQAYGLSESLLAASTDVLTPPQSSTASIRPPSLSKVKVEPRLETIYELSDDSADDEVPISTATVPKSVRPQTTPPVFHVKSTPEFTPSTHKHDPSRFPASVSVVDSLQKLVDRKRSKSILSRIDYNTIQIQQVEFLPPQYDRDVIFEFPLVGFQGTQSPTKQLGGMDKRYDGHGWSRTITSNIKNVFCLTSGTSSCLGHLRCENGDCDFLTRVHRTTSVNETVWDRISDKPFDVGSTPPVASTLVCKVCKAPPPNLLGPLTG